MATAAKPPMTLYITYSQRDEALKQEFEDYLVNLQQAQYIAGWIERQVQPGADWSQEIDPRLDTVQVFIVLLSPSLLASGYCSGAEFRAVFEKHTKGEARVIPILLRSVDLTGHSLDMLQRLPGEGRSVVSWPERSEAWWDIYRAMRRVAREYQSDF